MFSLLYQKIIKNAMILHKNEKLCHKNFAPMTLTFHYSQNECICHTKLQTYEEALFS